MTYVLLLPVEFVLCLLHLVQSLPQSIAGGTPLSLQVTSGL